MKDLFMVLIISCILLMVSNLMHGQYGFAAMDAALALFNYYNYRLC